MSKKTNKKRSLLIDIILLSAIFSTFLVVIFLTFVVSSEETTFVNSAEQTNEPIQTPKSETSEADSPYKNIKIVTDVSNDYFSPFAIQYPLTAHATLNDKITSIIEETKSTYIQKMHLSNEKNIAGELNVSFEIFPFNETYYSFLIKTVTSFPNKKTTESYESFFFNNENGKLYTFNALLASNDESLKTVSSHVYKLLREDKKYAYLSLEQLQGSQFEKWATFNTFIINDEKVHFYFNKFIEPESNIPTTVAIPMSSINALLAEQFQKKMVAPIKQPVNESNEKRKLVALTFDDGPHPEVTPQVLDLLGKYNAKATFFMLGSRVQHYPEITKNVFELGHEVGNHTWNHPMLTKMTEAQIMKEYSTTEQAIIQATGSPSTVFRPPYGATNQLVKKTIDKLQVNWTIDTEDWKHRSANLLLPSVKNALHNNSIILMHDIHQSTADGLEAILQFLHNEGYEFVTVSEMMEVKKNK